MRDIDPALLRALVVFADTGSLARVAAVVGRTPSAVTSQLQRLEEIAGVPLLQVSGRGRVLTKRVSNWWAMADVCSQCRTRHWPA